jgi:beta-mannosidase
VVQTDLLALGKIPDPFVADHEKDVAWVPREGWEYRRPLVARAELLQHEHIELVFEGVDGHAEILVNGTPVLKAENQFHEHRVDIKPWLVAGSNEVLVRFTAPLAVAEAGEQRRALPCVTSMVIPGGQYLRKAPYHFGWDWGPKLVTLGLWKDVALEAWSGARLDNVRVAQRHDIGRVQLEFFAELASPSSHGRAALLDVKVTAPDGEVFTAQAAFAPDAVAAHANLTVERPALWWPNGAGAQPLYRVEVTLRDSSGATLDQWSRRIGLRTIELVRQKEGTSESFRFEVNGVPVFCKGSNWIPADSFVTRVSRARVEQLLRAAVQANQNMLRVWGGGIYESEDFFDLCDELGLLVWHDFMFACAVYPLNDPEYVANVRREVQGAVRRLRHRACIALWCGNNELEIGWMGWGWDRPDTQDLKAADAAFFREQLPAFIAEQDPDRAYWPSSPCSPRVFTDPNSDECGDTHLWDIWHGAKPFEHYRSHPSRFVSEFGFQALPCLETVRAFAPESEHNLTSYLMEHHQRGAGGNTKILSYLADYFRVPKDFASLIYVSQLLQAEALRVGIEHWRRLWPSSAGALYWQLNDCWPVISWATVDYFGRWKLGHYAVARAYAPVLLSLLDEAPRFALHVVNETRSVKKLALTWSLERLDGTQLSQGEAGATVAPNTSLEVASLDLTAQVEERDYRKTVLVVELREAGKLLARRVSPFARDKHLELDDPELEFQLEFEDGSCVLHLEAATLARFVDLRLEGAPETVFSDNGFDLPAKRGTSVRFQAPQGWAKSGVERALRVRSLIDSYTP